jgi:hypothetical protein
MRIYFGMILKIGSTLAGNPVFISPSGVVNPMFMGACCEQIYRSIFYSPAFWVWGNAKLKHV